jgi:hypothetical protein
MNFLHFLCYLSECRESGIGLPHSTTLARISAGHCIREVVECGSPMPLFHAATIGSICP